MATPTRHRSSIVSGLLLSLSLLGAAPASAQSHTFDSGSFPSGTPFDLRFHGALLGQWNDPFDLPAPWAGQMLLHTTAGDTFQAWCVDLFHDLNVNAIAANNTATYSVAALQSDSSGVSFAASNSLSAQQIHDVQALANYGNQQLAGMASGFGHDLFSGEVQVAIWDTIYKGKLTYEVTQSAIGGVTAQDFYDAVAALETLAPNLGTGSSVAMVSVDGSGHIQAQGLVGNFQNLSPASSVPEPESWALMGLGLVALARRRRPVARVN